MMWMMLWMLMFWIAVAGAAVWLFASFRRRNADGDAMDVLRGRLARGEIDVDEFRGREEALRRTGGERRTAARGVIIALAVLVAVFIAVPAIIMAANGWDMWDMHGRGRNTSDTPAVQGGSQANVRIEDFAFEPGNLEVPLGATVTWTNQDSAAHDATARNDEWHTERLSEDESDTLTFEVAGDYDYYCSIHPSMKARLIVR